MMVDILGRICATLFIISFIGFIVIGILDNFVEDNDLRKKIQRVLGIIVLIGFTIILVSVVIGLLITIWSF